MFHREVNFLAAFLLVFMSLIVIYIPISYLYLPYFTNNFYIQDGEIRLVSATNSTGINQANDKSSEIGDWGTFGDFIGGTLNPFFTFFSVLGLLYTIHQNNKTLEINKEEMRLSREALKQSATAQTEMEKTQKLQQFDGILTIMLSKLREFEEKIGLDKIESDYELFFKKINNNVDLFGCARNIFDKNIYIDYFALICGTNKLIKDLNFEDIYLKDKYLNLLSLVVGQKNKQIFLFPCR